MCKSCSHKGSRNINYKYGKSLGNHKCIDCGVKIKNWYAKRCRNCAKQYVKKNKLLCGRKNGMYGKLPKYRKIKYKGIKMRSSWEVAYAKYLDKQKINWQYEPKTFDLGNETYTPDFYLPKFKIYIEIKGYITNRFKRKFKLFKQLYYYIQIIVLKEPILKSLEIIA
jgi:predicted nuclease of restriction endonuclease-like RecB superfamily